MRVWPAGSESADRPLKTNRAACSAALTGTCWAAPRNQNLFPVLESLFCCVGIRDAMSNARAVRYRRLALAKKDKAKADLLLKLADEAIGGFSAPLNGVRPGYPAKMSSRQKQETPRRGLSWTH
jgi:hypothetical protein